jgi:endoglucanase
MREQSLEFLRALVATPAPSGYESELGNVYRDYVKKYSDDVVTDTLGNVTAIVNPNAAMKIMLAGHMDEIGFMVHYVSDDGFLYFRSVGGNDSAIAAGQKVWVHGRSRIAGVVGTKAIHLQTADEQKQKPLMKDLWIDIGARTRHEAEDVISLGDVVTVQAELQLLLGDRATARAFDNKAGVLIIAETLRLLAEEPGLSSDVGVYGVATVQEEIGSRGATTAAFAIKPQTALAVDMGQALDVPNLTKSEHGEFYVGRGPGIPRGANIHHQVFELLKDAATSMDIPYQVNATPSTNPTDAKALQISRDGIATGLVEVPLRYMHTPCETLSLTDVENSARLMAAYCRSIKPDTGFRRHLSVVDALIACVLHYDGTAMEGSEVHKPCH